MNWESRSTVVNRLTKPPSNVHSSCNLDRTDANSSGVHATESSPYKVKDDKALLCQGVVVLVVVGSSFDREPVAPSSRTGGPIGHGRAVHRIVELGGWVRIFAVMLILMTK
jgi:hypothetical protein